MRKILVGIALVASLAGCGQGPEKVSEEDTTPPVPQEDFTGWPKDTIEPGSGIALVERNTDAIENDPEENRVPCFYSIPDWAEPNGPIGYKCPKGGTFLFHLLKADAKQRENDLRQWERLSKGEKIGASVMVVARPWRGWYGEAAVGSGDSEKRTRIYTLYSSKLGLQMQIEWPVKEREALTECEQLVQAFLYSVQAAPGSL